MLLPPSCGRRWLTHTPTFPPVTVFPSFSSVISSPALFALNCAHSASSWSLCVFLYNQCLLLLLFVLLLLRLLLHLLTRSMPSDKQRDCCCICWSDQDFLILSAILWASITCEYSPCKSEQLAAATHQLAKLLHKLVCQSWCETRTPAADTDKWHLSRQPDYRLLVTSPRLQVWGRQNLPTNQVDTSC